MILHSLQVSNWRSLLAPVNLGPFSERLNVIHAPNGTGKSSLFEAMRRAFFDAHLVSGREIEAVRPWGRPLAPQVRVEFTQAGTRYRVEKTFLDGASAVLSRWENGKFQPLANSRNADAELRKILSAVEIPGRGLSKQEHWGCAQALWAPQGALHLESLSPGVAENLRAALGVQLAGNGGSCLEQLLEERYQTYFTKGGRPRTGKQAAPILALESERETLKADRAVWIRKHQEFEQAARSVEDARQKRSQTRREADALAKTVKETRQRVEVFEGVQSELEQKGVAERAAKERFESLKQTLDLIRATRTEIQQLEEKIGKGRVEAESLATELSQANAAVEEARRKRDDARKQERSLDHRLADLEDARAFLTDAKAQQALLAKIDKLRRLEDDLKKQKLQRAALVAPDEKTIREVRKMVLAREKADAALKACQIHLTICPKKKATVQCDEPAETRTLDADEEVTFSGAAEVRVSIAGFGSIRASGPEGGAAEHEAVLRDSDRKIAKLTQPYGTTDPDRLQAMREQADVLDQAIQHLAEQISELLDGESAEDLGSELSELQAGIKNRLKRFPEWVENPPVLSELQAALDQQRKSLRDEVTQAEDGFDAAQKAAQALHHRQGEVVAWLNQAKHGRDAAKSRCEELTKDGQSDEARAEARNLALMTWESARTIVEKCETKLKQFPGDPRIDLKKLERQLAVLEQAEALARDQENKAQGSLETYAAEGAYSKLVACEEKLADLENRIQREQLRMEATRLLYDTVIGCKAALVAAVAAPVERTASRMLARIAGTRLGAIRLTESFVPTAVQPELATEPVELINLSGGEQEQLFMVTRLALGQLLAKEERQLVVLDDVLNATDTGRLARLLTVLEEASDHLQIVILTCHPERYGALEKAEFFDLQNLMN